MKKSFYTLFFIFSIVAVALAQVPRKTLLEEATQASCPPCASQNPPFDALLRSNDNLDKITILKYQVWWPGSDPMYDHNRADVQGRIGRYTAVDLITGAPGVVSNGTRAHGVPSNINQGMIDNWAAEMSPVSITMDHEINESEGAVDVTVTVKNETADVIPGGMYRLQVVLTEDEINYPSAPGSNGEREFSWVMRKFMPDTDGNMLTDDLGAGEEKVFTFSQTIPWYTADLAEIAAVAFVENATSYEVIQSEHSEAKPLMGVFPDLATSYTLTGYDGYCDDMVDAEFNVRNAGANEVNSFDINVVNSDGTLSLLESWAGSIMPGATETVTVSGLTLNEGGYSQLFAVVSNIDGKPDANGQNSLTDNSLYIRVADAPFASELSEGFEPYVGLQDDPDNAYFDKESNLHFAVAQPSNFGSGVGPVGGYAQSQKCVFAYFWAMPKGTQSTLVYDKFDFTDGNFLKLSFDIAHVLRSSFAKDKLEFLASTDCGENWQTIYEASGNDLTTNGVNSNFFIASANDWETRSADMSFLDGEPEVLIVARVTSDAGNNLFLDNFEISSSPVGTEDDHLAATISVYPNPATDVVNVEFDLLEGSQVNAEVYDVNGKTVAVIVDQKMTAGAQAISWNPTESGVYMISINTEKGKISKQITVIK